MTEGLVATSFQKDLSFRDITEPLPWNDHPVVSDIAIISLVIDADLRLLLNPAFDEMLQAPALWEPPNNEGVEESKEDEGPLSLHSCLKKFATREQLGEMDEWYCPGCKSHVRAFKKMDLWKVPPVLVFHLKRFSYEVGQWATHREKLDDYVDFPYEIDMRPYVLGAAAPEEGGAAPDQAPMLYELIAVCNHMGHLGFGHYTAYTKRGKNWYCCDDSSVTRVRKERIKTAMAYVLFYARVDPNAPKDDDDDETAGARTAGGASPRANTDNVPTLPYVDENGDEHEDDDVESDTSAVPVKDVSDDDAIVDGTTLV